MLSPGLGYLNVPAREWKYEFIRKWSISYQAGFKNKYFLNVNYVSFLHPELIENFWAHSPGWGFKGPDNVEENMRIMTQKGFVMKRSYRIADVVPNIGLLSSKNHQLHIGAGYTYRKAHESATLVFYNWEWFEEDIDREDHGIATEVSYQYTFLRHFVTGLDIIYRNYNHGDPLLSGTVKVGFLIRH